VSDTLRPSRIARARSSGIVCAEGGRSGEWVHGKFLAPNLKRWYLDKLSARVGIRSFGWHVFRHTFATQLTHRHVPLNEVQALLGHTSIEMTRRYAHESDDGLHASVHLLSKPLADFQSVKAPGSSTAWHLMPPTVDNRSTTSPT